MRKERIEFATGMNALAIINLLAKTEAKAFFNGEMSQKEYIEAVTLLFGFTDNVLLSEFSSMLQEETFEMAYNKTYKTINGLK